MPDEREVVVPVSMLPDERTGLARKLLVPDELMQRPPSVSAPAQLPFSHWAWASGLWVPEVVVRWRRADGAGEEGEPEEPAEGGE